MYWREFLLLFVSLVMTLVILLLDASDIGDDLKYQAEAPIDSDRIHLDLTDEEPLRTTASI